MGSLTQALSIALSGLQTSTSLISLASNNISNANTVGYTVKTASTASVDYGSDFGGVQISSYGRASDQALTTDYNNATSVASYASTQNNYLSQLQTVLGSSSSNPALSADIANLSSAWSQYSSDPGSVSQQQSVISAAQTLCNDMQTVTTQTGVLRTQIQSDVSTSVTSLNADLQQIATLNGSIQAATTAGLQTVDLQDQLDTAVNKVSAYMNVSVQTRSNGQIALYTPSGQLLVDGINAKSFSYNGTSITDSTGTDVTNALTGGSLQAATDFISTTTAAASSTTPGVGVIAKLQSQLSSLATALTSTTYAGTTTTNPNSFASAYNAAVTASTANGAVQAGQSVASSLFTVSLDVNGKADPSTLSVNTSLTDSSADLPELNTTAIASSFNSTDSYTASGLSSPSSTYAGLTSAILSNFQQMANTVSAQSSTATSQQTYYQTSLSNKTGVNTDTELANLVAYQNSYAASAHVISTVNQMLSTLMSTLS